MICAIWSCSFGTRSISIVFFFWFLIVPKEFGLWIFCCQYNVYSDMLIPKHNKCSIATDSGRRPPRPVVLAAHRARARGLSASAAGDPARAGERWRELRPEPSQLALIRYLRPLRVQPEDPAGATSGWLERGNVRLHVVHAARLAWSANAAGHRPASQLRTHVHRRLQDRITRWLLWNFLSVLWSTCYLLCSHSFSILRCLKFPGSVQFCM
jgi:hypothetical protein